MSDFVNPYPPLGASRTWRESYIFAASEGLSALDWTPFGPLTKIKISTVPDCSGIYMFVWTFKRADLTPFDKPLPAIVYIGRSENLKKRLSTYVDDKKRISSYRLSERRPRLRDAIKLMLEEYGEELEVYYAALEPNKIAHYEDALIKIFDPIFNTAQKVKKEMYENYEKVLNAKVLKGNSINTDLATEPKKPIEAVTSSFGDPEPAFK